LVNAVLPVVDSKPPGADRVSIDGIHGARRQLAIVREQFMDGLRLAVVGTPAEFDQQARELKVVRIAHAMINQRTLDWTVVAPVRRRIGRRPPAIDLVFQSEEYFKEESKRAAGSKEKASRHSSAK
jgi:hypothetical protein